MTSISRRFLLTGTASLTFTLSLPGIACAAKIRFLNLAFPKIPETEIVRRCIPVPFADFDYYYTDGELHWRPNPGQNFAPVVVPSGFCTDLTSVPRFFWSFYPKTGRYAYAAIVHDYLYWVQKTTRAEADDILRIAMEDTAVGSSTTALMY